MSWTHLLQHQIPTSLSHFPAHPQTFPLCPNALPEVTNDLLFWQNLSTFILSGFSEQGQCSSRHNFLAEQIHNVPIHCGLRTSHPFPRSCYAWSQTCYLSALASKWQGLQESTFTGRAPSVVVKVPNTKLVLLLSSSLLTIRPTLPTFTHVLVYRKGRKIFKSQTNKIPINSLASLY